MAKLNVNVEKVSELILDAVKILPDYKEGEKLIKDFLTMTKIIDKNQTKNK